MIWGNSIFQAGADEGPVDDVPQETRDRAVSCSDQFYAQLGSGASHMLEEISPRKDTEHNNNANTSDAQADGSGSGDSEDGDEEEEEEEEEGKDETEEKEEKEGAEEEEEEEAKQVIKEKRLSRRKKFSLKREKKSTSRKEKKRSRRKEETGEGEQQDPREQETAEGREEGEEGKGQRARSSTLLMFQNMGAGARNLLEKSGETTIKSVRSATLVSKSLIYDFVPPKPSSKKTMEKARSDFDVKNSFHEVHHGKERKHFEECDLENNSRTSRRSPRGVISFDGVRSEGKSKDSSIDQANKPEKVKSWEGTTDTGNKGEALSFMKEKRGTFIFHQMMKAGAEKMVAQISEGKGESADLHQSSKEHSPRGVSFQTQESQRKESEDPGANQEAQNGVEKSHPELGSTEGDSEKDEEKVLPRNYNADGSVITFEMMLSSQNPTLLDTLSIQERKRQNVIHEIITTERSYVQDVRVLLEVSISWNSFGS